MSRVKRREFITLLSGEAATGPLAARAQQSAMLVVRFLNTQSAAKFAHMLSGFIRDCARPGSSKVRTSRSNIAAL